ncbi:DsbA family protein [Homoserinibacter sp. YIM 151385]|uniref:DsbA family protein n=1 Tax=Homoserinibacter sp. YIM 151385 TaxID=2985506 RepID=UPI0022F02942|nr:thioredoxin domain-containing protein [Homoserinibacter sp. YIM 151385]WBU38989.1 thioredoxin domain-containing protein [Homoserinibacter sp. YIM 151385]
MPEDKLSKNQRREAAREAARISREKARRRERALRIAVPAGVTLALLAIGVVVALVIVNSIPKVSFPGGPENMASDGILFQGDAGEVVPVATDAIPEDGEPTATEPQDGIANIVSYVDWACPACKSFEEAYAGPIADLVASGGATLEVHPVAILDNAYAGSRYSSRAANAAACVSQYAPESFLDVQEQMFQNQPSEGTTGLTNGGIKELVQAGGVDDPDVMECIDSEGFEDWVAAATERAEIQGTPTLVVNGTTWNAQADGDFMDFVAAQVG